MTTFRWPKDDEEALGDALASLRHAVQAGARSSAGEVPDPTPPAVDVRPASLTVWVLTEGEKR